MYLDIYYLSMYVSIMFLLFSILFYLMGVCDIHVFVCVYMNMLSCVCSCEHQRLTSGIFLYHHSQNIFFPEFDRVSPWTWNSLFRPITWPMSSSYASVSTPSSNTKFITMLKFYMDDRHQKSCPHACTASTLPAEFSPTPNVDFPWEYVSLQSNYTLHLYL